MLSLYKELDGMRRKQNLIQVTEYSDEKRKKCFAEKANDWN